MSGRVSPGSGAEEEKENRSREDELQGRSWASLGKAATKCRPGSTAAEGVLPSARFRSKTVLLAAQREPHRLQSAVPVIAFNSHQVMGTHLCVEGEAAHQGGSRSQSGPTRVGSGEALKREREKEGRRVTDRREEGEKGECECE